MLNFLKRFKSPQEADSSDKTPTDTDTKPSFFQRLTSGLKHTRHQLADNLATLFLGQKQIDNDLLKKLETLLLTADLGVTTTQALLQQLTDKVARRELTDSNALFSALQLLLFEILSPHTKPLTIAADKHPFVILVVGVNGSGKTTTIGKLANHFKQQGKSVLLAAGDTFRAAAIDQLKIWGERNNIAVVAQQPGSDSASVIFDAVQAAKARDIDVVIADTAGRLHTQLHLMDELKKVKRVIAKLDESAPHEVLLVLDASIGQNALQQAKQFHEAMNLTGIVLTKLDGTAKGGVIFAIANQLALPIRFIGIGEAIDDLRPFDAEEFIAALFSQHENSSS